MVLQCLPGIVQCCSRLFLRVVHRFPAGWFDLGFFVVFVVAFIVDQRLVDAGVFSVSGGHKELFGRCVQFSQHFLHVCGTCAGFKQGRANLALASGQSRATSTQGGVVKAKHGFVVVGRQPARQQLVHRCRHWLRQLDTAPCKVSKFERDARAFAPHQ